MENAEKCFLENFSEMQPNTIKYFLEIIFHFQKLFYGKTNTHLQVNKWFEGQLDLLRIIFFFGLKYIFGT
jgi:hypothetical protein